MTGPSFGCYNHLMVSRQSEDNRAFSRLIYRAYIRDGKTIHTGESVLLACLVHSKGNKSKDMEDVQRIMRDHNRKK